MGVSPFSASMGQCFNAKNTGEVIFPLKLLKKGSLPK